MVFQRHLWFKIVFSWASSSWSGATHHPILPPPPLRTVTWPMRHNDIDPPYYYSGWKHLLIDYTLWRPSCKHTKVVAKISCRFEVKAALSELFQAILCELFQSGMITNTANNSTIIGMQSFFKHYDVNS